MEDYEALKVLGAENAETFQEVTSLYKKLAIKLHPDKHPGDESAKQRLAEVNAAYTHLSKRNSSNSLVLPVRNINNNSGVKFDFDFTGDSFLKNLDEDAARIVADYFAQNGPGILKPFFRNQKGTKSIQSIINFIAKHGLMIPEKIKELISTPKNKKKKSKPKVKPTPSKPGKAYIHKADYDLFEVTNNIVRRQMALRCILERKDNNGIYQERMDLCFPEGLDPKASITIGPDIYKVKVVDLGFPPVRSISDLFQNPISGNPPFDHRRGHWDRGRVFPDM